MAPSGNRASVQPKLHVPKRVVPDSLPAAQHPGSVGEQLGHYVLGQAGDIPPSSSLSAVASSEGLPSVPNPHAVAVLQGPWGLLHVRSSVLSVSLWHD